MEQKTQGKREQILGLAAKMLVVCHESGTDWETWRAATEVLQKELLRSVRTRK